MKYEILFIVRPDLEENAIKDVFKKFETILVDNGAKVLSSKELGQKELAYEINKHKTGYYFLINVESDAEAIKEFDRLATISEELLRHIIIKEVLIGRLTRDPELRYTSSNIPSARFSLAVDRPFTSQSGERETDFINIVVWRKQAENVKKYITKGSLVAVEGRIQTGSYEKDGQRVYTTDVVADNVQFLESKAQSQNRPVEDSVTPADFANDSVKPTDMNEEVFADFGDSIEISDDDIAF